ncbi:hypothetical protein MGMO_52c00100 [Methyloglobulus morosus KoM1]|uniref:Uncharacterized protein n=1 Tax=Methyloglobulus morosus KoM1 TaxID=1116472 RepID=V5DZD6_9GAMM|nr:hypothetical protein MGMO_52c00100 [Methyloglobulus morosus KoM1]
MIYARQYASLSGIKLEMRLFTHNFKIFAQLTRLFYCLVIFECRKLGQMVYHKLINHLAQYHKALNRRIDANNNNETVT